MTSTLTTSADNEPACVDQVRFVLDVYLGCTYGKPAAGANNSVLQVVHKVWISTTNLDEDEPVVG